MSETDKTTLKANLYRSTHTPERGTSLLWSIVREFFIRRYLGNHMRESVGVSVGVLSGEQ
jgi:hypothetical protein